MNPRLVLVIAALTVREIARRPDPPSAAFDARLLAEVHRGVEAHARVAAERDRLLWRVTPLLAVERAVKRSGVHRPARTLWSATHRLVRR